MERGWTVVSYTGSCADSSLAAPTQDCRKGEHMGKDDPVALYIAAYDDPNAAQGDYDALKELVKAGAIFVDVAALVSRDDEGKLYVKENAHEVAGGTMVGAAAGLLIGLIFPPAFLASGVVGGAVGAGVGKLVKMDRTSDIKKEVEDVLPPGRRGSSPCSTSPASRRSTTPSDARVEGRQGRGQPRERRGAQEGGREGLIPRFLEPPAAAGMMRPMSASAPAAVHAPAAKRSNAYDMFIFVLTVLSFAIMAGLVLPRVNPPTKMLLNAYDNIICLVFLFDFGMRMRRAPRKRDYFFGERGWLRSPRLDPELRLCGDRQVCGPASAVSDQPADSHRSHAPAPRLAKHHPRRARATVASTQSFITLLAAMIVIVLSSVFVLQFESKNANANIQTGGEALWWAIVTMTTVGYGDYFPITPGGRITGVFVMITGIGIIGALASIFASLLVSPGGSDSDAQPESDVVSTELRSLREEVAALREQLIEGGKSPQ